MRRVLPFLLALAPTTLPGQEICAPDFRPHAGTVPACWNGAWYGGSDALDRFSAIMAYLPPDVHAQMTGALGSDLMIAIYPDGGFVASQISGQVDGMFIGDDPGDDTEFHMDLFVTPGMGRMWEDLPGRLSFCTEAGAGIGVLSGSATNAMGSTTRSNRIDGSTGGALTAMSPGGFTPEIDINCHGDRMEMFVHLPDPIGTVTYLLSRIPESRMPPEFRRAWESRFAD